MSYIHFLLYIPVDYTLLPVLFFRIFSLLVQMPVFLPSQIRRKVQEGGWVFGVSRLLFPLGSFDPLFAYYLWECTTDQQLAFNGNNEAYSLREMQVPKATAEGRNKHTRIDVSALVNKDHRWKYFFSPCWHVGILELMLLINLS